LGAGCAVLWEICFISNPNDMKQWDLKKEILMKKIAEIAAKYDDLR
ncbi:N-acetylmuramoyl-L-alanine amidase, partial [Riemerella anatipestifer]|nr:N-acetylmuramoyl-L-alanine amidase [Riemerella anatipestifer]